MILDKISFVILQSKKEDNMGDKEVGSYGRVIMVVGMQYGSEGKGAITEYLAPIASMGIRSGAANAGHTIYYKGQKFIMRQIPSVWINPLAKLVVGVGSLINLDVLFHEIKFISKFFNLEGRLFIDRNAHVITDEQIAAEQKTDLASRIGSTSATAGEGIGMAMVDKVLRSGSCRQAKDVPQLKPYIADTVDLINAELDRDQMVLLEGTQGLGLSIEHGHFPYTTSRDTSATAIAASVGIATHRFEIDVIGVTRTFPIRVAGNSGPFGEDSKEVSWEYVRKFAKSKDSICEKTTVTGNVRRVATFSWQDFLKACKINRPTEIALTFADYLDWRCHEKSDISISNRIMGFIDQIERKSGVPVALVKTGPRTIIDYEYYRRSIIRKVKDWD